MSVYLRQIICNSSSVVWECTRCSVAMDMEEAWLADEGALCGDCCRKLYPQKFKCDCGTCFQCMMQHDQHSHEWKKYVGVTDVYEYCDCGTKRRIT